MGGAEGGLVTSLCPLHSVSDFSFFKKENKKTETRNSIFHSLPMRVNT